MLTPADEINHINKHNFKVPVLCGCRDLGEALRRVAEGCSMIRTKGASRTLVPIRPRRRGERRSLRTFPGVSLRPPLAFNPRPRRLSTPLLTPLNSTPTFARMHNYPQARLAPGT